MELHQTCPGTSWLRLDNWIMQCVSSVSYSFLVNDLAYGEVIPQWGIYQRDPLSPYIFIIYCKSLSKICHRTQSNGTMTWIKLQDTAHEWIIFSLLTIWCSSSNKINKAYNFLRNSSRNTKPHQFSLSVLRNPPPLTLWKLHRRQDHVSSNSNNWKEGGVGNILGLLAILEDKSPILLHCWRYFSLAGKLTMLKRVLYTIQT